MLVSLLRRVHAYSGGGPAFHARGYQGITLTVCKGYQSIALPRLETQGIMCSCSCLACPCFAWLLTLSLLCIQQPATPKPACAARRSLILDDTRIQPDSIEQNEEEDDKVSADDKLAYKMLDKKDKDHIEAEDQFYDEFEVQARLCPSPPAPHPCGLLC